MKKLYFLLLTFLITTVSFAQVFITELADPNDNANARYIELYNAGSSVVDLSTWRIDKYTNASATVSQTLALTGTIPSGGFYIIATGPSDTVVFDTWGVTPNQWDPSTNNVAGSNGDDNLELYDGSNTLIDQFGVPGVDGTATNHEFEDGRAERRASVATGNATWNVAEWDIDSDAGTGAGFQNVADSFDPGAWIGTSTAATIVVSGPLTGFDYFVGSGPSTEQTFTVEGTNLTVDLTVTAPTNFEISLSSGSGFSASEVLRITAGTVSATTVYVRLKAGLSASAYSGDVTASSTGATNKTVALSGAVTAADPLITLTGTAITEQNYVEGSGPSIEATFTVEALFLTTDLTVTAPTNFEVSTTTGTGFAASVNLTQTSGTVATATIYVRLKSGLTSAHYSGNATASSTGATDKTLAISGTVYSTTVTNAMVITGVFDAQDSSSPKGVELFVIKNIADLSLFGVGSANNGGGTDGQEFTFPAGAATAGQYIYVIGSNQTAKFTTFFGFAPDHESGAMFINGDDAIELFENTQVIDLFGDINVDGTGQPWEYLDGWAYRNSDTGPSSTFTIGNWQFSGTIELDGATNADSSTPFTPKTYTNTLAISKQQLLDGFAMYPNPTRGGLLNIQSASKSEMNISIFDVIGKQVYQRNTSKTQINISNLKAGMYFVKVLQDGKMATRKLVVE